MERNYNYKAECPKCGKKFLNENPAYHRHVRTCKVGLNQNDLTCPICNRVFKRIGTYNNHIKRCKSNSQYSNITTYKYIKDYRAKNISSNYIQTIFNGDKLEYFNDDEIFLINFFRVFNPDNISFKPKDLFRLIKLFNEFNPNENNINTNLVNSQIYMIFKMHDYIINTIKNKNKY